MASFTRANSGEKYTRDGQEYTANDGDVFVRTDNNQLLVLSEREFAVSYHGVDVEEKAPKPAPPKTTPDK